MRPQFAIFVYLCFGTIVLSNIYGCNKASDPVATQAPVDSAGTKTSASKNCIDSVLGTYYGHTEAHDEVWYHGNHSTLRNYSGPGFMTVSKVDSNTIKVLSTNFLGPTNYFTFDTSGVLYSKHGAFLTLKPSDDSVGYDWDYEYGDFETRQKITAKFRGKK
jgi:hypothetical protein